jgi:hypothetical protein
VDSDRQGERQCGKNRQSDTDSDRARLRRAVGTIFSAGQARTNSRASDGVTLPLEFDDRVRIETDGEGQPALATVVGMQYHEGRKAVAVRFSQGPCDWVVTQP